MDHVQKPYSIPQILELLYYISGPILALIAAYAAQQVRLVKRDTIIRNERAAKEKAIEFASRYLCCFVPLSTEFTKERSGASLPVYEGPTGQFAAAEISGELRTEALKRLGCLTWLPALNELQAIASAYVSGVADEQTGFDIIGRSYCATVGKTYYDIISMCRNDKAHPYWNSIVQLYRVWSPRLTKAELDATREFLEKEIEGLPDFVIPHIG